MTSVISASVMTEANSYMQYHPEPSVLDLQTKPFAIHSPTDYLYLEHKTHISIPKRPIKAMCFCLWNIICYMKSS